MRPRRARPLNFTVRRLSMLLRAPRLAATLLLATLLVAAAIPMVTTAHLHPTVLFAVLAYLGWGVVASVTSGPFADHHVGLVLSAAFVLNVLAFLAPVGLIWLSTRARLRWRAVMLYVWGPTYLALLYFAFPIAASA